MGRVEAVIRLGDGGFDSVGGGSWKGCCEMGFHLCDLAFFLGGCHSSIVAPLVPLFYWSSDSFGEVLRTSETVRTAFTSMPPSE